MIVVVFLVASYVVHRLFNPYDEVRTVIRGIPPDTDFLCLIAETSEGPEVMLWSHHKVFPFTMHPNHDITSFLSEDKHTHRAHVRWIGSARLGVLRRIKAGKWFLSWYDPPRSELHGRSFLFGGGSWEGDLREASEEQSVTKKMLQAMGVDETLKGN